MGLQQGPARGAGSPLPFPWPWITVLIAEQLASPADQQPAPPMSSGLVPLSAKEGCHSPRCGIKCGLWSPHLSLLGSIVLCDVESGGCVLQSLWMGASALSSVRAKPVGTLRGCWGVS